ncbi:hypothetical protein PC128_g19076 [Phytophthora cactorum]|nr:hypothetical protein PC128_g19076 [Phytophthora cactorum]KAG4047688.1 hypothetical protein PC123_g16965 [Phytophthora cactorum]
MQYEGHKFNLKREYLGTRCYSCAKYKKTKCLAKLVQYPMREQLSDAESDSSTVTSSTTATSEANISFRDPHTCDEPALVHSRDVQEEMRELIKKKATEDHVRTAAAVWEWAHKEMTTLHGMATALTLLKKQTGRDLVYRTRQEATGGDIFRLLEMAPFRFLSPLDTRPFLQFNVSYTIKQELQRIIGFGHPGLMYLLNYQKNQLFIDGTFDIAPNPFKQAVIVMVFDHGRQLFVSVFYCLAQSKSDWTYWHILHWVKVQSGMKLDPGTVCCDFEMALLQGVKGQFPDAKRISCLFHWKQAIRRKLAALRISEDKIKKIMARGALDTLTVLPPAKIERGLSL